MSINLTDELLAKTKKGKIASAKQVFLEGDKENLQQIGDKTHQLENAVKDITVSGGASTANAVYYNNETSGMTAINAQGAIDELAAKNATKAEQSEVTAELEKKFDKESILQESGDAEDKVMSQKTTTTAITDETKRAKAAEEAIMFDVSVQNNGAVFESLQALLSSSNLSTLIPTSVRHGGMSIRFIQSSDNNYVQYRLMANEFTTDVTHWQGVDEELVPFSKNLIESKAVSKEFHKIKDKTLFKTNKKGLSIADKNGEIALQYDEDGLDAGKVTDHFKNIITSGLKEVSPQKTTQRLFTVTDENGNIAAKVDEKGSFDAIDFGTNLSEKIDKKIESKNAKTVELGFYITDENGNTVVKIDDEGIFEAAGLDKNTNKTEAKVTNQKNYEVNNAFKELKDDESFSSRVAINDKRVGGIETTITLNIDEAKDKLIVPIKMHYGAEEKTPEENDVFFEGNCKTDFSDVRFFDANGKMLKANLGEPVDLDVITDSNLDGYDNLKVTSEGYLVGYSHRQKAMFISTDDGVTFSVIPGTQNIAQHIDEVWGVRGMMPVLIDSNDNIFAFCGGKLYKLTSNHNGTYNVPSVTDYVLDFSFVETSVNTPGKTTDFNTIYPVSNNAAAEDVNGNIYFGTYQATSHWRAAVYVSKDGGDSFSLSLLKEGQPYQHVHHIHADKYSSKVYVGVDDGGSTYGGNSVFRTSNGGTTWEDITYNQHEFRCKDYYPSYFGQNYRLGGGEVYVMGGAPIIKSSDDTHFKRCFHGWSGVRGIADFGNDLLLIAGTNQCDYENSNRIIISKDKGDSWKTISWVDQSHNSYDYVHDKNISSSGAGYRNVFLVTPASGDPYVYMSGSMINKNIVLSCKRVYKGTNRHYREAYLLLEDVPVGQLTINVKTGYVHPYSYKQIGGYEPCTPVYNIVADEGIGCFIKDSNSKVVDMESGYKWENDNPSQRYGDYGGVNEPRYGKYSSAVKLDHAINFGRCGDLDFSKDYTIAFWLNRKNKGNSQYTDENKKSSCMDNILYKLASLGSYDIYKFNQTWGLVRRGETPNSTNRLATLPVVSTAFDFQDDYAYYVMVVERGKLTLYINGKKIEQGTSTFADIHDVKLSEADIILGSNTHEMVGYIADFKIYKKVFTRKDVIAYYKGFN